MSSGFFLLAIKIRAIYLENANSLPMEQNLSNEWRLFDAILFSKYSIIRFKNLALKSIKQRYSLHRDQA